MWYAWERGENCTRFKWERPEEEEHLEDRGVDGKMGSERILVRLDGGCGVDSPCSGQGMVAGCCEYSVEPPGYGATELVS
jgi:hypothetical protein